VNISQSVEGNKLDRFTFKIFPRDDPLEVENGLYMTEVFLVEIELIYNKQEVLKSGKLLFIDRGSGGVYFGKELEMSNAEFEERYVKPRMSFLQHDKELTAELKLIQAKKNKPLVELIDGLTKHK
jgi:hypothetical protein